MGKKLKEGYIHIYTGDGKGKTTAALGLAFRAVGHDYKVFMIQFMKGCIEYGELETARRLAPYMTIAQMVCICSIVSTIPSRCCPIRLRLCR